MFPHVLSLHWKSLERFLVVVAMLMLLLLSACSCLSAALYK